MDMKIAIKSPFPIMADQISKAVFKEEKVNDSFLEHALNKLSPSGIWMGRMSTGFMKAFTKEIIPFHNNWCDEFTWYTYQDIPAVCFKPINGNPDDGYAMGLNFEFFNGKDFNETPLTPSGVLQGVYDGINELDFKGIRIVSAIERVNGFNFKHIESVEIPMIHPTGDLANMFRNTNYISVDSINGYRTESNHYEAYQGNGVFSEWKPLGLQDYIKAMVYSPYFAEQVKVNDGSTWIYHRGMPVFTVRAFRGSEMKVLMLNKAAFGMDNGGLFHRNHYFEVPKIMSQLINEVSEKIIAVQIFDHGRTVPDLTMGFDAIPCESYAAFNRNHF